MQIFRKAILYDLEREIEKKDKINTKKRFPLTSEENENYKMINSVIKF